MSRNQSSWLAACLFLIAPNFLGATPITAADLNQPGVEGTHATERSDSDALQTARPTIGEAGDLDEDLTPSEANETQRGMDAKVLAHAGDTPIPVNGPTEGALWIYALGGCTAVGLVAFRVGDKRE